MSVTIHPIKRLEQWLFEPPHQPPVQLLRRVLAFFRYPYAMVRDLLRGDLNLRAMSLVYTTLLSVVPLVAFGFALLKAFGLHRDFEPLLYEFLRPVGDQSYVLTQQIIGFVDNTRGGVLGSVGLALLLYTVVSTVQKVEESFNFAWHVEQSRSIARRVSEYLSLMVIGPALLVLVLGLFGTAADWPLARWLETHEPFATMAAGLGRVAPYLVVTAVFTLLYLFVPNTRVRFRAALAGGLTAGLLWAASGTLFTKFVVASTRMVAIYAGFAIFLVALIWVYLSWLILLVGAQLSFYVQNPRYLRAGQAQVRLTSRLRERLALSAMVLIGRSFAGGGSEWTLKSLAEHLEVPSSALAMVMEPLEQAGLVLATERERLVPGRALDRIEVHDILTAVREERRYESWLVARARTDPDADAIADAVEAAMRERMQHRTLRDLVAGTG